MMTTESGSGSNISTVGTDSLADQDADEMFVWPWIGILVNIPTQLRDGRHVGGSGSNLRDQLTSRGFNPTRVRPLWNHLGHSGTATVEFVKDWNGFNNALSFENFYAANRNGKRDWLGKTGNVSDIYGWVARTDDYNADNIIGKNLRKMGDLRTVSDIMDEEARKTSKLVHKLTNDVEAKNMHLKEMESKLDEIEASHGLLISENDKSYQSYSEELKKVDSCIRDHLKKILNDHEKFKLRIDNQKREHELREQELQKRAIHIENERKKIAEEVEKNAVENCAFLAAYEEEKKTDEKILSSAEEEKKEKEMLQQKIIHLEKQLDGKQTTELDIEQLRSRLKAESSMLNEGDWEVLEEFDLVLQSLRQKEKELENTGSVKQKVLMQEQKSKAELQEMRKELINSLKDLATSSDVGIKRMGELDSKPFYEAMKMKYSESEADDRATELCSLWEEYLRDPEWHPVKVANIGGTQKVVIDEDDKKLMDVKENYGIGIYNAVMTALLEVHEYNPTGDYTASELWNYAENRRATVKEGVVLFLDTWKRETATSTQDIPESADE